MDELESSFCIEGTPDLKCKEPRFDEFENEIPLMKIILAYFRTYLPSLMIKNKDCRGRWIKMDKEDIGVSLRKEPGDYIALLVPTDDLSSYPDDTFTLEDSEYAFELQLRARDIEFEGALENLIILKSVVKTMLVNMDYNLGLAVEIEGFSFGGLTLESENKLRRDGTYRFSITDSRVKRK